MKAKIDEHQVEVEDDILKYYTRWMILPQRLILHAMLVSIRDEKIDVL